MSTALAIASVTYVLKDLLNNGLIDQDITGAVGGNVSVTALPPDRIETGASTEGSQLNLFMYQATPNPGWRNHALPAHNARGDRTTYPPLALDLHYLLCAYGAEELHPEILLGYGMQLLHETPVLTRDAIRASLAPAAVNSSGLPPNLQALSTSNLAEQIELIKITPETLNTEELSRLWSAFGAKYRPNAAYKITVVLIESTRSTKAALPVQSRKIFFVVPFKQPHIEKIASRATPNSPVATDQKVLSHHLLVISGRLLKKAVVGVNIDGIKVTPAPAFLEDTQITIPIPATLGAGIHGVQVVHQELMGSPPVPHEGTLSNVAAFVLCPRITALSVTGVSGSSFVSATINLSVTPAIFPGQQATLLLNEITGDAVPLAYSFQLPAASFLSPPGAQANISIPVAGVQAGTYLVRIRVDGAESPLLADATGNWSHPNITLP